MSQNLDLYGGNYTTTKANFAAGTTTTTTTTTGAATKISYAIGGKAYAYTPAANAATPTTDAVTGAAFTGVAANKGSVFVFGFDAAGAIKVAQGEIKSLDAAGAFVDSPQFPTLPDTVAAYAYLVIKAGSSASTWTMGSSNMASATGITYTFVDVLTLPARPQIS